MNLIDFSRRLLAAHRGEFSARDLDEFTAMDAEGEWWLLAHDLTRELMAAGTLSANDGATALKMAETRAFSFYSDPLAAELRSYLKRAAVPA